MRPRHLVLVLAALGGCAAGGAAAESEEPAGPTVATIPVAELASIETLTTEPPATTLPLPPESVAVVGDSLTVSAEEEIVAALDELGVRDVVIDAAEGRRINHVTGGKSSGVTAAGELAATGDPDVWVIALGTNDVPGFGPTGYRADIEALLAELPPDAPVIWVDTWIKGRIDEARQANAVLRDVAAEHPQMTVVDWFQFGDDPGLIISDGIHLAEAGQQRFAEQIAAAVATVHADG